MFSGTKARSRAVTIEGGCGVLLLEELSLSVVCGAFFWVLDSPVDVLADSVRAESNILLSVDSLDSPLPLVDLSEVSLTSGPLPLSLGIVEKRQTGMIRPALVLIVPPIRDYMGFVAPMSIPESYPLPNRPRRTTIGYED
ncbi:hypothetical protein H4S08_004658 [Coemansia sp. RSA 1365]|nr:hypothetical protein H4S08_004658 [Coemansia sp. RSA 1365]